MDLEDTRTLKSLSAEELEHVNLGLFRSFECSVLPFISEPDFFGVFHVTALPVPGVPYGDLLPSSLTLSAVWAHCNQLFPEDQ